MNEAKEAQALTAEMILSMPAGREMDALVAERVLGWYWSDYWAGGQQARGLFPPPPSGSFSDCGSFDDYSATWDGAGIVATALYRVGWRLAVHWSPQSERCGVGFGRLYHEPYRAVEAWGDDFPLAICRAALLTTLDQ